MRYWRNHLNLAVVFCGANFAAAQRAWFADGYHGGVYGHYPPAFTQFMLEALQQHPEWRLNLEIEPETWDFARTNTPEAYAAFQFLVATQTPPRRIEFVSPAYGQSYLWNISGESVIQHFDRGMRKIRGHFPQAEFTTYCSEEPCFTSALPGILKSFGFKYAVLKNPNTCWGGYTRAQGGELVNWVGPDGTGIRTVPRYGMEALKPGSTWETIAAANAPGYLEGAREAGIQHPIGMCLQDAGWRWGPWLQRGPGARSNSEYVTWRQYFETVAMAEPAPDWRFSQEDVQVSLVWGAQVLQRIAQQVRSAENRIVMAEKIATVATFAAHTAWPENALAEAWRPLLLSQHHDCWIVPYNGRRGDTWADKVRRWTDSTQQTSQKIIDEATLALLPSTTNEMAYAVRVFNSLSAPRTNELEVQLPEAWQGGAVSVWDSAGHRLPSQATAHGVLIPASAPSLGYRTFWLKNNTNAGRAEGPERIAKGASVTQLADGRMRMETDLYRLDLDPAKGGTICSLIAKALGNRELVDQKGARRFNEIRGFFFRDGRFYSTVEAPAKTEIVESGPLRVRLRISSQLSSNSVTQLITLAQGEPRIDFHLRIDWQGSPGIGAADGQSHFRAEDDRKAFYDDRAKLLALFPLKLRDPTVFKDAPFDITESRLTNTFFENWSGIKNNILLHWVDVCDRSQKIGVALFTDHTTSYEHGADHPLGLTLQYSGVGLWGRNYDLEGPTEIDYAILPHAGTQPAAAVWTASCQWNEPLIPRTFPIEPAFGAAEKSFLTIEGGDWEVPTARFHDGKLIVRLFNPSADTQKRMIRLGGAASKVQLVQLNGELIKELPLLAEWSSRFEISLRPRELATLQITLD